MIFKHGIGCRRWWPLQRVDADGDLFLLWPVRFAITPRLGGMRRSLSMHGWQVGYEDVPRALTSASCMPGFRGVFGQTVTLGPIQLHFGPNPRDPRNDTRRRWSRASVATEVHHGER